MTRDAFEKAKDLDYDISAVEKLRDIINGCCKCKTFGDSEREQHNDWIDNKKVTLCYLVRDFDRPSNKDFTALVDKETYWIANYIQGADIPIDLYVKIRDTIDEYIDGLEKEFDELNADYEYGESED